MNFPIEQILEELKEIKQMLHDMADTGKQQKDEDELLSRSEACMFLHCSLGTLHNWNKSGQLKPLMIGKKRFYPKSALLKIMSANNNKK